MKKILIITLCTLGLLACDISPKNRPSADPKLNLPPNPHGGRYRVGNLGGKPVLLGEGISFVEYEDSPTLRPENRRKDYESPLRNFDSVITSFGSYLKYTTGLLYVGYGGSPKGSEVAIQQAKETKRQFRAEWNTVDHHWLSISINAGSRYPNIEDPTHQMFINSTLDAPNFDQKHKEGVHYFNVYVPTNLKEFDLEEYDPHPQWVNAWEYKDTKDMYIYRDANNKVTTLIWCRNLPPTNLAYQCDMFWTMEPDMRIDITVTFQRVHLKDWRLMQAQTEKLIKSLVVDPNNLPKNNNTVDAK